MGKLTMFNFITLNGYYKGQYEDISWHKHGADEGEFSASGLRSGNTLLFGRVTYQLMAGFWPTTEAMTKMPEVAYGMNNAEKIVFSRTMKEPEWNNTTLIKDNIAEEIKKLKYAGKSMTILGSGSIVTECAEHGLIDEYEIMIDPVALGDGTPMFKNMTHNLELELTGTRAFKSGIVLLSYRAKGSEK